MKSPVTLKSIGRISLLTAALLAVSACTTTKIERDPVISQARTSLTSLQSDPKLANLATAAVRDAEEAVSKAEKADLETRRDKAYVSHLAYLAKNKVDTARAQASTLHEENKLKNLSDRSNQVLLDARNREVSTLEQQLADLKQKQTDRGLVFTLGDVLFSTGSAAIKSGSKVNISRLAERLNQEPNRTIVIEGHTDSSGSESLNDRLSQQRADAVKVELVRSGVSSSRITSVGKGQHYPVASNNTSEGKQQNRRVEVILQ